MKFHWLAEWSLILTMWTHSRDHTESLNRYLLEFAKQAIKKNGRFENRIKIIDQETF